MYTVLDRSLIQAIHEAAHPLLGAPDDLSPVLARTAGARFVLIGGACAGTHEFHRLRSELTKRLIKEQGFTAVAVDCDWPDAYRVNRFVRGAAGDITATEALSGLRRFSQRIWRNAELLDFVGWLRAWNDRRPPEQHAGFYGLDHYQLHASMEVAGRHLTATDPEGAYRVAQRYSCFDHFALDMETGGPLSGIALSDGREAEAAALMTARYASSVDHDEHDPRVMDDHAFYVAQHERFGANAPGYYRALFGPRTRAWNMRERHMAEGLSALAVHLDRADAGAKVVVWGHSTHMGDASATEMAEAGAVSVGQLVRHRAGTVAILVGSTTYDGTITAAPQWGEPIRRMRLLTAQPESTESHFHHIGIPNFVLDLGDGSVAAARLAEPRLDRAVGLVYHATSERIAHYYRARLARQFDLVVHYDHTRAVEPLERTLRESYQTPVQEEVGVAH